MGLLKFNNLPVNTLVGADWNTFQEITNGREVDAAYQQKFRLTRNLCRLLSLFTPLDDRRYERLSTRNAPGRQPEHDPVFIIGHWRSGTTFVHNVLAHDPHFAYNTTYQTVFPHLTLWGQPFFKLLMRLAMPTSRPTDHMELGVNLPQEEEFTLAGLTPCSFYNFWFFPRAWQEYADRYLLFTDISPREKRLFRQAMTRIARTACWNTRGTQLLSKNPAHTGRVAELYDMFPHAKFIYLVRNPYDVFESSCSFFAHTIRPLQFQEISSQELEENILVTHAKLYRKYEEDRRRLPSRNLMEVRFEDFEADPLAMTRDIYRQLDIPGYAEAEPHLRAYIDSQKGYRKNLHRHAGHTVSQVHKHWDFAFDRWGYERL